MARKEFQGRTEVVNEVHVYSQETMDLIETSEYHERLKSYLADPGERLSGDQQFRIIQEIERLNRVLMLLDPLNTIP